MAKKIRTNLGVKGQGNRRGSRRVSEVDETLIPKVVPVPGGSVEIRIICARCNRAGKYMIIDRGVEYWFCMEHYFSY